MTLTSDTQGLPMPDSHPELDALSYQILKTSWYHEASAKVLFPHIWSFHLRSLITIFIQTIITHYLTLHFITISSV